MRRQWTAESSGARLDRYLADQLPGYSRSQLKALIERGCVTVEGRRPAADDKVKAGERIVLEVGRAPWPELERFERWVRHEDKELLVLDKPAGLLMHPLGESWLRDPRACLLEVEANLAGLLLRLRPQIARSAVPRAGIVHRLDRQTSGVLLVAKTAGAYDRLVAAFKERRVSKIYRAVVRGLPQGKTVQAPVGRNPGHRRVVVTPFGKTAETAFRVIEAAPGSALVEARPLTGRTHQIRAHLGFLGAPVMGDPEFDQRKEGQPWPPRMLLHAYSVELEHPGTGRKVRYTAPLPEDFRSFWSGLKKQSP